MNLLPHPRSLQRQRGHFVLPRRPSLKLDASLPSWLKAAIAKRLEPWAVLSRGARGKTNRRAGAETGAPMADFRIVRGKNAPTRAGGYSLTIDRDGVLIEFRDLEGLHASVATLRQLLREYPRRLPFLKISDWPDFLRRGVMLDVSRGRVPKLQTLLDLVDHLADFKINEFQLYTEHTFAYRDYRSVWHQWGALTGAEIRKLDVCCRELGIDLVPNQNSFGHLRYWLEHPRLKQLAEVAEPYESAGGGFLRRPSTLAPNHPGTLPFLRELYDELLPNFSSRYFNVGCDETWDLGRGQSQKLCERRGKGRVYLDFLKQIHREVSKRGRRMMFWGDIILRHPELIPQLPKDVIALNWGYEATHPFDREAARFAKANIPFYVCPGTSTWQTLIGRHDNALKNLRAAAATGRKHGAAGYLMTDWGDGGHPQPLAVSYLPYLAGAALAWHAKSFDERRLVSVLSRDIFCDPTQRLARVALALGLAHRRLGVTEPNATPLGTAIMAPPPEQRELFCHHDLENYLRIPAKNIQSTLEEVERHRALLARSRPTSRLGKTLAVELDLAARMAAQSCQFMRWQQTRFTGKRALARQRAKRAMRELRRLDRDFSIAWPLRNKGSTRMCSAFLKWRIRDYEMAAD